MALRAMALAPFEPDAQRGYALAMIRNWGSLEPDAQGEFSDIVRRVDEGGHSLAAFAEAAYQAGRKREWEALLAAIREPNEERP